MTAERVAIHELSPEELGRRSYQAMNAIMARFSSDIDFASAAARDFFKPDTEGRDLAAFADRKIIFQKLNGKDYKVHFLGKRGKRNKEWPNTVPFEEWEEFNHYELRVEKWRGNSYLSSLTLKSDRTMMGAFIDGEILLLNSHPNSEEAYSNIGNFMSEFNLLRI